MIASASRLSQNSVVRNQFGTGGVACALLLAGCLSETLMDRYHDGATVPANLAGAPPRWLGVPEVTNEGAVGRVGAGFVSLSTKAAGAWTSGSTTNSSSGSGYQTTGFWQAGCLTRLHFGVTETNHVVVMTQLEPAGADTNGVRLWELTANGGVLRSLDFPAGAMPEVFRLLPDGSMVFAGRLDRDLAFGTTTLRQLTSGYFVVRLDADWHEQYAFGNPSEGVVTLRDIAVTGNGSVYLATNELGVLALESNGSVVNVALGVLDAVLAIDERQQSVLMGGRFDGELGLGGASYPSRGGSDGVLVAWDDLSRGLSQVWQLGGGDEDEITSLAIDAAGNYVVGGSVGQSASLLGTSLDVGAQGAAFVARADSSGRAQWARTLGEAGRVSHLATRDSSIYVAAYVAGKASAASGMRLVVSEFTRAGEMSASFAFDDQPAQYGHLALDSSGVIWLSALGQIRVESESTARSVSALYRIVPERAGG